MKERLFGSVLTATRLEYGAFEGRVEHVVRDRQVAGHHMSTFLSQMKPSKMEVKKEKASLYAFPWHCFSRVKLVLEDVVYFPKYQVL